MSCTAQGGVPALARIPPARELRSRRARRWFHGCAIATVVCASGVSWPGLLFACTINSDPIIDGPECSAAGTAESADASPSPHTSVLGVRLDLVSTDIRRSSYPPPGNGDCGELGSVVLQFRLNGFDVWPSDVAVLLYLTDGAFLGRVAYDTPPGPGWFKISHDGAVYFSGPDDPGQPIDAALVVRVVDCDGNVSLPTEVHLNDSGRQATRPADNAVTSDTPSVASGSTADMAVDAPREAGEGGCAIGQIPSRASRFISVALAFATIAARRARRRRSSR